MVYSSPTMHSKGDQRGLGDLEARLARNEKEQKELLVARSHHLESSLRTAQQEVCSLRERYQQLREDFQFNLVILDQRDRELESYDVRTATALTAQHNRQEELHRLRLQLAELQTQTARETQKRQEDAAQHQLQLDELKCSMAGEIQKQREEYERKEREMKRRIQEVETQLTLQRQEMTAAFDSELRQQEHEFILKTDEMHAEVLSRGLKVDLLSKETEVLLQTHHQTSEALKASKDFCQEIQNQLDHKEEQIRNITAARGNRIKELEDELKWMKTKFKKEEEEYIKKYEDLLEAVKQCSVYLEAQYQTQTEQLHKAEKQIVQLQGRVQSLAAQLRCIQEEQQKTMRQKDETIQRLAADVEAAQSGWSRYISQVSSEMVVKNTEIISLQERETRLRTECEKIREETERYKQQLGAGLQREKSLEQQQVQDQLEWQRRCEDIKTQQYLSNEQLIQDLIQARDQAQAELKEKDQDLKDLTVLLQSVKAERDQALQGLTPRVNSLDSDRISCLQQQNSILRSVVTQMKKDMEGLLHLLPSTRTQPQASCPQPVQHPEPPGTTSTTPTANTVMATGPQTQPTNISFKISPAGGPCLEKPANNSALAREEVKVAQTESALTNLMEQRALVRQLQEEKLYLRQQASKLKSGGLQDSMQGKSNPPLLYSRLKQAASCIAALSREKQQLIEMVNCLRAQIHNTGLQGGTDPEEPEKDSSTEEPGDQHGRLFALELLQHQLTTQELQYALRQSSGPPAQHLLPGKGNQSVATEGSGNPGPLESRSVMSSSESLRSLNQLWEILDHGVSPSLMSEGEGELSRRTVADGVQIIHGVSAPVHSQAPTEVHQKKNPPNTTKTTSRTRTRLVSAVKEQLFLLLSSSCSDRFHQSNTGTLRASTSRPENIFHEEMNFYSTCAMKLEVGW
ncbi:coiled-coil domain-containing protein 57 [Centropristis striata]|uniref:coiled-coil domain-containing protein 57 n=1 Tax=Centropristis striata TaxID=184440 RepID=UPI0027E0AB5F|nr:coiled-coil domain-containing protein 57 [Centropristis striata]